MCSVRLHRGVLHHHCTSAIVSAVISRTHFKIRPVYSTKGHRVRVEVEAGLVVFSETSQRGATSPLHVSHCVSRSANQRLISPIYTTRKPPVLFSTRVTRFKTILQWDTNHLCGCVSCCRFSHYCACILPL